MSVEQYLARHAEPEAALAGRVGARYGAALVVPALGEDASLLDGYRAAAAASGGRVLVILVVNASAASTAPHRAANAAWLAALSARSPREAFGPGVLLVAEPEFDLLVVDRSSPGRELAPRAGVGHARKLGLDLALGLFARGRLASPWLYSTDADARLPAAYFDADAAPGDGAALLFPFRHVPGGDPGVDRATATYEIALRYHVLGLAFAGSPYAYHSIGSALAVDATSYALVRGVPKRAAGEDFYLLDKLAKVAPLTALAGDPIEIAARRSARVPFGTGPGVARIAEQGQALVAHPDALRVLRAVLRAFDAHAASAGAGAFDATELELEPALTALAAPALTALGVPEALDHAVRNAGGASLRRRFHTWFDALKTLRFLHALRDRGLADVALPEALVAAPFTPGASSPELEETLIRLRELERALPARRGPAQIGASAASAALK